MFSKEERDRMYDTALAQLRTEQVERVMMDAERRIREASRWLLVQGVEKN